MSLVVVTPADDYLLTTVLAVKVELDISDEDNDNLIESFIEQASDQISTFTGRVFAKEQVKETIGATGLPEILLNRTPIVTVDEIKYDGTEVTDYSISSYKAGILYRETGWSDTSISWNTFEKEHPSPYLKPSWEFTYTAGYVLPNQSTVSAPRDLPHDLERACIDMVKTLYRSKSLDSSIKRYKVGDTDISFERSGGLITPTVSSVLSYYRRAY